MSDTILSGIRATGRLHFGNYLGAVQQFVAFQTPSNRCFYFIADWHTLTTMQDTGQLQSNLIEIVKDYMAAGLDPSKSTIYAQSSVPEIAELSLYLSMIQPLGDLQRTPTFKDLVRKPPRQRQPGYDHVPRAHGGGHPRPAVHAGAGGRGPGSQRRDGARASSPFQ